MIKFTLSLIIIASLTIGVARAQEITVVTYEWPPYNYTENGKITGTSTQIVQSVLNSAKVESEYRVYPWRRAYKMATEQKNILIYTIRRTPEREALFKWVGPITPPSHSYFYKLKKRSDIVIRSLEDARHYKIGVVRDDSMHLLLLRHGFEENTNLSVVTTDTQNLKRLFRERIDMIIWTELTLGLKAKALGLPFDHLEKVFMLWEDKEGYYMAFSRQTPNELIERVATAMEHVREQGLIESTIKNYLKNLDDSP